VVRTGMSLTHEALATVTCSRRQRGLIGTLTANTSTLSNSTTAGTSYGWEGEHGKPDQTDLPPVFRTG
jgi:hypothetical protein